jgi:dihydroorotate dehydrogenase electron transfer subunit
MGRAYHRMGIAFSGEGAQVMATFKPGQFVEIDLANVPLPPMDTIPAHLRDAAIRQLILRRPFSLCDARVEKDKTIIDIIYAAIGPATLRMTMFKPGDVTQVIGPLGNGFWTPDNKTTALLVAGGVGAPPVQHLAVSLAQQQTYERLVLFTGSRTAQDVPFEWQQQGKQIVLTELAPYSIDTHIATDDGSYGYHGLVTDCLKQWLQQHNDIPATQMILYGCGPEPMLAAMALVAMNHNIDSQVSLERRMACGFNICQGCGVELKSPDSNDTFYHMCCHHGPVFDGEYVVFE